VVHGAAAVVAVGTHLYAGLAFAAMGVLVVVWWVAARRRPDVPLAVTWALAAGATAFVYLPTLDDLRETSAARGSRYEATFPADAAHSVLGGNAIAVTALSLLCLAGVVALSRDRALVVAAVGAIAAVVGVCAVLWLVVQPLDLYPRFLVVLVPAVGLAAAIAVGRWPQLLVVAALAVVAMGVTDARRWPDEVPIRQTAEVLTAARARGLGPCAVGSVGLAAYVREVPEVREPGDLDGCDVFARVGSWGGPEIDAAARATFDHRWRVEGRYRVYSRVPPSELGIDDEEDAGG
jgi:hypothetical protein